MGGGEGSCDRTGADAGAWGDRVLGLIAKRLGLPVQLYVATNENDFMVHLLQRRQLQLKPEVPPSPMPGVWHTRCQLGEPRGFVPGGANQLPQHGYPSPLQH